MTNISTDTFLKANKPSGMLFDLDGVLYIGDQLIPGAAETVEYVKAKGIACRFVTNTTTRSLASLFAKVKGLGLPIEKNEIISPPKAAADYLREKGSPRCLLIIDEATREDFKGLDTTEDNPDYIVIGDYGKRWDFELLNRLFNLIVNGAKLLALHKGRYWQTNEGLRLDIGAFVTGLEYATDTKAIVIGKPERTFYQMALKSMGLSASEVIMVGDDIESDIGGAQRAGMKGVLVKTGKYRKDLVDASDISPNLIIDSVAGLKVLL